MEPIVYYAEVLLPLHLPTYYTYRIPQEYNGLVQVGMRVAVQFGRTKVYSAIVHRIHTDQPKFQTKYILAIIDTHPVVTPLQLQFWQWIATYYMSTPGDVMAVAMPAALKLASESTVTIHPDWDGELSSLSKHETQVVALLTQQGVMRVQDLARAIGLLKIMPLVRTMIERGIIIMDEELRHRYKPKTSTYINFAPPYQDQQAMAALLDQMEKKHRTAAVQVLLTLAQQTHFGAQAIPKRTLPATSALQTLIKNGILCTEERTESRLQPPDPNTQVVDPNTIQLNQQQQAAYHTIATAPQQVALLHGVTSSGKTEVYIRLIADVVARGGQVLFLLPEIALTTQLIQRLTRYFGTLVGVYHSRYTSAQRVEVWNRTLSTGPDRLQIILGARSALLLPFTNLQLIVIDEEHDTSYKQQDPAPRYHARDAAIYLATLCGARVVLGSATPSVESFHHATTGKYALASISQRYGNSTLPQTTLVDMRAEQKEQRVRGLFSQTLLDAISNALDQHHQVILYQNNRGFSRRLQCDDCHHTPSCIHCDVSLVYHKTTATLRCHYCGYSIPLPNQCPACGSTHLRTIGIGTQRIEEDLQILFPNANIQRLDIDSTSHKNRYLEILDDFAAHRTDILVGTQMITKGLDFQGVTVVGVISADSAITFPNFRAFERAFQQLTQVSGRAGRHQDQGHVYIQTYQPDHTVLQNVLLGDYNSLFQEQIQERRIFRYPPYYRLIQLTLLHPDTQTLDTAANTLANTLRTTFGTRVMGPEYPLVSRIRNLYIKQITLRFQNNEPIADAKRVIQLMASDLLASPIASKLQIHFDVDPY